MSLNPDEMSQMEYHRILVKHGYDPDGMKITQITKGDNTTGYEVEENRDLRLASNRYWFHVVEYKGNKALIQVQRTSFRKPPSTEAPDFVVKRVAEEDGLPVLDSFETEWVDWNNNIHDSEFEYVLDNADIGFDPS